MSQEQRPSADKKARDLIDDADALSRKMVEEALALHPALDESHRVSLAKRLAEQFIGLVMFPQLEPTQFALLASWGVRVRDFPPGESPKFFIEMHRIKNSGLLEKLSEIQKEVLRLHYRVS